MSMDITRECYVVLAAPLSRTVTKMLVYKVSEYDQELPQSPQQHGKEEAKHDNSLMTKLVKLLSHSFPDKFCFTLSTAETSKK